MPTSCSNAPAATTTSASRRPIPWSVTITGSTPALTRSRSRRSPMLSTIWTWTQEWSDMPRRSEVTWAMCHQARSSASAFTPSSSASSLRLPRVGARTLARSIASAGVVPRSSGPVGLSASLAPSTLTSGVCQARRRRSRRCPRGRAECRLARGVPSREGCPEVDSSARAAMRPARLRPADRSPKCGATGLLVPECTCEACHLELMREHAPWLLPWRQARTRSLRRAA